jgi:hypothetical protein
MVTGNHITWVDDICDLRNKIINNHVYCKSMFSGTTYEANPFRPISCVVGLSASAVFSPSPPLAAWLLRTKSVYWANPTTFSVFPILSAFALRIDGGWVVEIDGIEKRR